jgi:ketosteroid isomerase-like protein
VSAGNVELVRRLWRSFDRDGLDAVLAAVDPDVVWEPYAAGGRALHGPEAVREFYAESAKVGRTSTPEAYSFEAHGDCVLVTGSLRFEQGGALSERQLDWVYFFRGPTLVRAASFPTRDAALAAIAAFEEARTA